MSLATKQSIVARRADRLGTKIAAVLTVLFACLVVAEICMHRFFYILYHETPDWMPDGHVRGRYKPNQSYMTGPAYNPNINYRLKSHPVHINKYGFRGPDWSPNPQPGTLRIALLGASAAFSYHDREEETWAFLLGQCMTEKLGRKTEVVNLAIPGVDAEDSKINYMINGRFFNPAVVIVYHTWNDLKKFRVFEGNSTSLLFANVAPAPPGRIKKLAARSQLVRLTRKVYYRFVTRANENSYRHLEPSDVQETKAPSGEAFRWYRRNFEDIAQIARSDGVIPVLVSQATLVHGSIFDDIHTRRQVGVELVGMTLPVLANTWQRANRILADVATDKEAVFINGYDNIPHSLEYIEDHVHLTPKGNRALADLVCSELSSNERILGLPTNASALQQLR
jgi:hypothetical protein